MSRAEDSSGELRAEDFGSTEEVLDLVRDLLNQLHAAADQLEKYIEAKETIISRDEFVGGGIHVSPGRHSRN